MLQVQYIHKCVLDDRYASLSVLRCTAESIEFLKDTLCCANLYKHK